jgi:hypothetical protein
MTRKTLWPVPLMVALTLASGAFAQAPKQAAGDSAHQRAGHRDFSKQRDRFERKARLMRLLAISDALELSDAAALQLDKTLAKYDARRRPLQDAIMQGVELLRRAAHGDAEAYGQVDPTLKKMVEARSQHHAIDFEMFQEIAKGLSPQQRARLALVMARLPSDLRAVARGGHGGHGGHGAHDE